MRDWKRHLGKDISISTHDSGEFHGKLVFVGRDSLEISCTAYFSPNGEKGPAPTGILVFDRFAIAFAQVR